MLNLDYLQLLSGANRERFCQNVIHKLDDQTSSIYLELTTAIQDISIDNLSKRSKSQQGWIQMNATKLL